MGVYSIKPAFVRSLTGIKQFLVRFNVSADALTATALLLSLAGAWILIGWRQMEPFLVLVPILALGRITLNALDGMVAIDTGTARPFGEVLNEVSDRLADSAWMVGLAFAGGGAVAVAALIVVLLSSYLGTVSKAAGGRRIYGGVMGKADRMIVVSLVAVGALFLGGRAFEWGAWIILLGAAATFVQRLVISHRDLTER